MRPETVDLNKAASVRGCSSWSGGLIGSGDNESGHHGEKCIREEMLSLW